METGNNYAVMAVVSTFAFFRLVEVSISQAGSANNEWLQDPSQVVTLFLAIQVCWAAFFFGWLMEVRRVKSWAQTYDSLILRPNNEVE